MQLYYNMVIIKKRRNKEKKRNADLYWPKRIAKVSSLGNKYIVN